VGSAGNQDSMLHLQWVYPREERRLQTDICACTDNTAGHSSSYDEQWVSDVIGQRLDPKSVRSD
jgi:hypothetical protein